MKFKNLLILLTICLLGGLSACSAKKTEPKTILLVSGWQDVNIGDIAHTPGLIHVLNTFIPDANIILWEKNASEEVENLIHKHFPKIRVIKGAVDKDSIVENQEILDAFKEADIMIHGSGPYVVGQPHLEAWLKYTEGKPFGIFGTTIEKIDDRLKNLLSKASFIYTRETQSIEALKKEGITGDHIAFAPDATFFLNIHDEEKATTFLKENNLEDGKYICAIPRLRKTPYYKIKNAHLWSKEGIQKVEDHNNKYKEEEHAKLREAIVAWVRTTGNKVLVCPEMTYQVDIMDELLINPLPEDVKPFVVKRGYWMPDEAASVYKRAYAVLSFDCHSPIIACANGTPFFYFRQPEDTSKGQMYYDLNFSNWIFEIDETTGKQITDRLFEIQADYPKAQKQIADEMEVITEIYKKSCEKISEILYR